MNMKEVLLSAPGEVALADLAAPQPQTLTREAPPLATPASPRAHCQTKAEADAWAATWDAGYTPTPHADDLYFATAPLFALLDPRLDHLKWIALGAKRPRGTRFVHPALEGALASKTAFTEEEWQGFKVKTSKSTGARPKT